MSFLIWLLISILTLYLLISVCTTWLQPYFIFRPEVLPADFAFDFQEELQEVWVDTPNDGKIHALWRKKSNSKGVVLYYHGNAGSLKRWGNLYYFFERHNYDLLIFDYRGYGKSKGKLRMDFMYSDAESLYSFVRQHYSADQIILYGRSMGASFATHVAATFEARMLILETPFSSMEDLFYSYFPFLPRLFPFHFKFQNRYKLKRVPYPVYLFHGTADWVIPLQIAEKLKRYLKKSDQFFTVVGGGHNDLLYFDHYQVEMDKILKG